MTRHSLDEFFCWRHREKTGRGRKGGQEASKKQAWDKLEVCGSQRDWGWPWEQRAKPSGPVMGECLGSQAPFSLKCFENDLFPVTLLYVDHGKR